MSPVAVGSVTGCTLPSPAMVVSSVHAIGLSESVYSTRYVQPFSVGNENVTVLPERLTFVTVGCAALNTVTVKAHVFVLLPESTAVQVTVVVPSGKSEPEAGVHVTIGAASQLSVAVAVKVARAELEDVQRVTLAGQLIVGAVVSTTVKVAVVLGALPAALETVTE